MTEPSPLASRLTLAIGAAATILVGGAGFLLGQRATADKKGSAVPTAAATIDSTPLLPVDSDRLLDRADLLELVNEAADSMAAGEGPSQAIVAAAGRRFAFSIPFGCNGPTEADSDDTMRWRYDDEASALRVSVAPVSWSTTEWSAAVAPEIEAIEGFWIPRPWTSSEVCPVKSPPLRAGAGREDRAQPTLAIGQAFGASTARQGRRDGKAYSAVERMPVEQLDASQGLVLRLTGRLSGIAQNAPVICRQPGGADHRPSCLITVSFDEVTILEPGSGAVLASWQGASARE